MNSDRSNYTAASRNLLASILALLTLLCLGPGLALPFVRLTSVFDERLLSIIDTIGELIGSGRVFLAVIILVFSVLFPLVKPILVLVAVSSLIPMTTSVRGKVVRVAERSARWSMADVLVLAIFVVGLKVEGLVAWESQTGMYFFVAVVLASLATGLVVAIPVDRGEEKPMNRTPVRAARKVLRVAIVSGTIGIAGIAVTTFSGGGTVKSVLLRKNAGIDLDEIRELVDSPDFYLVLKTEGGVVKTGVQEEPIGNGLRFDLANPLALDEIRTIAVMDKNLNIETDILGQIGLPDRKIDRVEVRSDREIKGGKLLIHLEGPESAMRIIGWILSAAGAVLVMGCLVILIVRNVVGRDFKDV